jgi:hypothetical protein
MLDLFFEQLADFQQMHVFVMFWVIMQPSFYLNRQIHKLMCYFLRLKARISIVLRCFVWLIIITVIILAVTYVFCGNDLTSPTAISMFTYDLPLSQHVHEHGGQGLLRSIF